MSAEGIERVRMPKWGLSMTEGRVVEWLVDEGAEIAPGDDVAEVETDKLNANVEAPAGGVLRRRLARPGEAVPVGGLLAVLADPAVPDEEIDRVVEEFRSTFVPGEEAEEAGPRTATEDVDGRTLRYAHVGEDGPAVVLLHGFGGDLDNWMFVVDALAEGRTVISLDLPGHGGSSKGVGDGGLDMLVGALAGFLDARGLSHVHLVGHSLGGAVAAACTAAHPDRVASLSLVAPAGLGPEINADYVKGFVAAKSRRELKPVIELLFADPGRVTRQLLDDVLRYKRLDGVEDALGRVSGAAFPEGRQALDTAAAVREAGVPVLVVWGREDRIIPAAHAEALGDAAEVHVLDGAGHSPHMEAAGEVTRLVGAWVDAHPG